MKTTPHPSPLRAKTAKASITNGPYKDTRNAIAKALDCYMATANCDSSTLGAPASNNRYLRNRIEAAFLAGCNYSLIGLAGQKRRASK